MIRFRCPGCDATIELPAGAAGSVRHCTSCGDRVRAPSPPSAGAPAELILEQGDPRTHHYVFAHQFLPTMAHTDPATALQMVIDPDDHVVRDCWDWVGSKLEADQRMEATGLATSFVDRGPWRFGLVTLPPARRMPEAIFVALVFDAEQPGEVRAITLELSCDFATGEAGTVLAEWTGDPDSPSHLNLGPGPAPELGAFLEAVARLVGA